MKLSFYGGARALTGNCILLEVADQSILIDCGLEQACDEFNGNALDFYASRIDHVLVTHAHMNNVGRLPLLVQEGFYGRIITTPVTQKLMSTVLKETADNRMNDSWWRNQKGQRGGMSPMEPLFSMTDVVYTMQQVETEQFNEKFTVWPGIEARFVPSGHMPGAASIEMWVTEDGETRKLVFSGDIGCNQMPFAPPPTYMEEADFVVMEATYGDTTHQSMTTLENIAEFAEALDITLSHAGNVIIPANAIGRTQEVLYALAQVKKNKMVKGFPGFKVYLDSFLAEECVRLFEGDTTSVLGSGLTVSDFQGKDNKFLFDDLVLCTTVEQSKALNYDKTPKVIIASSGMSDHGRMKHHMKHNLWRKECAIMHIGFLGEGSFGRRLHDGLTSVKLFGEEVVVRAKLLEFTGNFSHADKPQLLDWLGAFKEKPRHVFIVHATDSVAESFGETLFKEGYRAHAPLTREVYDLLEESIENPGFSPEERVSHRGRSYSLPYIRLKDTVQELEYLVREGRWHTGEDFDKMTLEIRKVMASWSERVESPKKP